jgi:hypothetical protein
MNGFNSNHKQRRSGAPAAALPPVARLVGLMQLFASSLLCYGLTRFEGHPYFFMGALVFSIVFVVMGAWNLAERR